MDKEKLVEYVTKLHQSVPYIFTDETIAEAEALKALTQLK